ncbi:hypothetical protein BC937DRAFT_86298 [Endogone sp. FLAS-F59071]|nr:hypothetical protein BC937DRAFT_86298 [Endogone sp. FLAS-F59071]|eukprot:RUS13126.1 hypothetical protein BC937DRAFT_86298 [Endogone sp. FLAS-F59071]
MTAHVAYDRQESGLGGTGWMYHDDRSVWDNPANKPLEPKYHHHCAAGDAYRSGCLPLVPMDLISPVETLYSLPAEQYVAPTVQFESLNISAATSSSSSSSSSFSSSSSSSSSSLRKRKISSDADEPFVSVAQKFHHPLDSSVLSSSSFSQPVTILQAPNRSYSHFPPLIQSLPAHPILSLTELSSIRTPNATQFNTQTTQPPLHSLAASQIVAKIMVELARRDSKRVRYTPEQRGNEQRGNEQHGNEQPSNGLHGNGQRYSASLHRVASQPFSMQHGKGRQDIAQMIRPTRRLLNLLEAATKHMPNPEYHINIQGWRGRLGMREELVSWMYEVVASLCTRKPPAHLSLALADQ